MERFLVVGVGGKGWERGATVVFPYGDKFDLSTSDRRRSRFRVYQNRHLLVTSLKWRELLAENERLTTADIVADTGFSPGRVRQVLRLGTLDQSIQRTILASKSNVHWGRFTEERLRPVVSTGPNTQVERFEQTFGVKVAKLAV